MEQTEPLELIYLPTEELRRTERNTLNRFNGEEGRRGNQIMG